jgi:molybdate transport system ATP-binding protein
MVPARMTLELDIATRLGDLDLRVRTGMEPGGVVAVLGPNGAGKSTLLRIIAGLHPTDQGRITLGGNTWDEPAAGIFLPPERRGVGVMFQDYLLFPHLSVLDNIAFGPRRRGRRRADARAVASAWLDRMGMSELASARPGALSGGQRQRVALARALAGEPRVLLLDEPTAALDAALRGQVRRDLARHLNDFGGVSVVVTHDPLDALALADEVLVLEAGTVTQQGPLEDVTSFPRSAYVAELLGVNLFRGRGADGRVQLDRGDTHLVVAEVTTGPVFAVIRPNAVTLDRDEPAGSARNRWHLRVTSLDRQGGRVRVHLEGPLAMVAEITDAAAADLELVEGRAVWASVKATEIGVHPV